MKNTDYTLATTDFSKALVALIHCLDDGYRAWIEVQNNGDQEYPIMCVNPLLDDPFNWTSSAGYPCIKDNKRDFINDTEKDLYYNYTSAFGTEDAIKKYRETGEVTEGLILLAKDTGIGVPSPVRIKDAIWYRKNITGDGYVNYGLWRNIWKPKEGIPMYVVDETVKKVYVICYSVPEEEIPLSERIREAARTLLHHADELEMAR